MTNYDLEGPQREIPACHKHATNLDPSAGRVPATYRCVGSACAKWVPEGIRHALRCGDSMQDAFVAETVAPSTTGACEDTPNSLPWLDSFAEAKAERERLEAEERADQQAKNATEAAAFAKGYNVYRIPKFGVTSTWSDPMNGLNTRASRDESYIYVSTVKHGSPCLSGMYEVGRERHIEVSHDGQHVRLR